MVDRTDGQWVGRISGDNPGWAVLELEQEDQVMVGTAYHFPDDPEIVPTAVRLTLPLPLASHQFTELPVVTFSAHHGFAFPHDQIQNFYPNSTVSEMADVTLTFLDGTVFVTFNTPITNGFGSLKKGHITPSPLTSHKQSWEHFRSVTLNATKDRYVFRGQAAPWRLRTTFHRSPKKSLERYQAELVPQTYKSITNYIKHPFDLTKPEETGALYDLLQHHGYPTPLLDWTRSPFVAAYFAFENAVPEPDTYVRIIVFERAAWMGLSQSPVVALTSLHLSFIDITPLGNDRAEPQQSVFTLTNVDDIEDYILMAEQAKNYTFLTAIDIPTMERDRVLADLNQMGIHHGSLFPGLDGACRAARLRQFGR